MEQQKKRGIVRRAASTTAHLWAKSLGLVGLADTLQRIGNNAGDLFHLAKSRIQDKPENHRHETFDEAVARLDLNEEHLLRQAQAFRIRAWSWFVSTMLATAWLAYIPHSSHPVQGFIVATALIFMCFAKCITWHFRFCQIRDQDLYAFGPWFRNPGRW